MHDLLLAVGTILLVFFIIDSHAGSLFLAATGILAIFYTFPLAYRTYVLAFK